MAAEWTGEDFAQSLRSELHRAEPAARFQAFGSMPIQFHLRICALALRSTALARVSRILSLRHMCQSDHRWTRQEKDSSAVSSRSARWLNPTQSMIPHASRCISPDSSATAVGQSFRARSRSPCGRLCCRTHIAPRGRRCFCSKYFRRRGATDLARDCSIIWMSVHRGTRHDSGCTSGSVQRAQLCPQHVVRSVERVSQLLRVAHVCQVLTYCHIV